MGTALGMIAGQLKMPEQELERKALKTFLEAELRNAEEQIVTFIARYGVRQAEGLEHLIRQRKVEEHPAWEDLIEWEGLEARHGKLLELLAAVMRESIR